MYIVNKLTIFICTCILMPTTGARMINEKVRYETNCGDETPLVTCERNYCRESMCDAYPDAECRLNLCNICKPVYYVNGIDVDCRAKRKRIVERTNCPLGIPIVTCSADPCEQSGCVAYPNAECRVNPCGYCKATFYVDDVIVNCNPSVVSIHTSVVGRTKLRRTKLSPCERENRRSDLSNKVYRYRFVVNCTADGTYQSLQCWPTVGLCWCVNKNGKELLGSRTYFPLKPNCDKIVLNCRSKEFGCCPDNITPAKGLHQDGCPGVDYETCEKTLYGCCTDGKTISQGPHDEGCPREPTKCELQNAQADPTIQFQPTCEQDGGFSRIQCLPYTGLCWCVDSDGQELEGTRTSGRPDCSRAICEDKRKDCWLYARVPGFCAKISHYMKVYCRKSCSFCKGNKGESRLSGFLGPTRPGCSSDYGCCEDLITPAKGRNDYLCPLYTTPCHMPKISGQCQGAFQRFYYDVISNRCETFIYGGCHGNENNFKTSLDCEDECHIEPVVPDRLMVLGENDKLASSNTGKARVLDGLLIPAHGYNSSCNSAFGCCKDGVTPSTGPWKLDCPRYKSNCHMPAATGPCSKYLTRYFYNTKTKNCDAFVYGGCDGNTNRFVTRGECKRQCIFEKESSNEVVGEKAKESNTDNSIENLTLVSKKRRNRIKAIITKTEKPLYNKQVVRTAGKIVEHAKDRTVKQGTVKNINVKSSKYIKISRMRHFKKLSECEKRQYVNKVVNNLIPSNPNEKVYQPNCSADGTFSKLQCWMDQGYCWCVDGDGNEIEATKSSRMPVCPNTQKPKKSCIDRSPKKCAAYGSRVYCKRYRVFMKRACPKTCGFCKKPVTRPGCRSKYGCCDDGIAAKRRDFTRCPVYNDICDMPRNSGGCLGYMERFYYDSSVKQCVEFIYGGCDGNKNNFLTRRECEYRCNYTLVSTSLNKFEEELSVTLTTTKQPKETASASTSRDTEATASPSRSSVRNNVMTKSNRAAAEKTTTTKNVRKPKVPSTTTTELTIKPTTTSHTTSNRNKHVTYVTRSTPTSTFFTTTEQYSTDTTTDNVDDIELSTLADNTVNDIIRPTLETHIGDVERSTLADNDVTEVIIPTTLETYVDNYVESFITQKGTFEPSTEGSIYSTLSTPFDHGFDFITDEPENNVVATRVTDQSIVVTLPPLSSVNSTSQSTIKSTKLRKYTHNKKSTNNSTANYTRSKSVIAQKGTQYINLKDIRTTPVHSLPFNKGIAPKTDKTTSKNRRKESNDAISDDFTKQMNITFTTPAAHTTISSDLKTESSAVNKTRSKSREADHKDMQSNEAGFATTTMKPRTNVVVNSSSTNYPYVTVSKELIITDFKDELVPINNKTTGKLNPASADSALREGVDTQSTVTKLLLNATLKRRVINESSLSSIMRNVSNINDIPIKKTTDTIKEIKDKHSSTIVTTTKSMPLPLSSTTGILHTYITEKVKEEMRSTAAPITTRESTTKVDNASDVTNPAREEEHGNITILKYYNSTMSKEPSSTKVPTTTDISSTSQVETDYMSTDLPTSTAGQETSLLYSPQDTSSDYPLDISTYAPQEISSHSPPDMSTQRPLDNTTTPKTTIMLSTMTDGFAGELTIATDDSLHITDITEDVIGTSSTNIHQTRTSKTKGTSAIKTSERPTTTKEATARLHATCKLRPERGICDNNLPRYHYNATLKQCILFSYSGCEGNGNNFHTTEECMAKCTPTVDQQHTRGLETITPNLLACNSVYGCCPDRVHPAKGPRAEGCPEYKSSCEMPPYKGRCRASITRWYFHKLEETCKTFTYGGCDGNENNFPTDIDCYITCDAQYTNPSNINPSVEEELEVVMYPGCNAANYGCCSDGVSIPAGPNQEDCPLYNTICDMPKVVGTCDNGLVRYYYDKETKKCDNFLFSGCGGNMNNFDTMDECNVKCQRSATSCQDSYYLCKPWKERGFCESSPDISGVYCKLTCGKCQKDIF